MRMRIARLALLSSVLALPACQLMPEGTEPADHQLSCGDRTLGYSLAGDRVQLYLEDGKRELRREESASGALYRTRSGDTEFWSKGERVTVILAGQRLPECRHTDRASLEPRRWRVVAVEDNPVPEQARPVTLNFMPEGRLAGRSGCNHFMAAWERVGDRLIIERGATTRMACSPSVMDFEQRFLGALSWVENARREEDGTLVLVGRDEGRLIRAAASMEGDTQ
ncbi:META domain-containing protein [Salicola sp. Rm-C-2C1-2]|uniref:META domain-containing protein n=1 Tax=Salicola sp. Rm-C-2C1-2 TaxID=3141321 RepID=UPI0032E3BC06